MWMFLITALLAALVQQYNKSSPSSITFRGGADYPSIPKYTNLITEAEKQAFKQDGFILKKGLLQENELKDTIDAGDAYYKAKATRIQKAFSKSYAKLGFDIWRINEIFAQVAMESVFPSIAAELMGFNSRHKTNESVRILRDGFFGFKSENNSGCGFHVDDSMFWPATANSTGVTFWVALSPMRVSEGGGIRLVNQTLSKPFFSECKAVIQRNEGKPATCHMERLSPECHQKMMESSLCYNMEPGDVLIWDRWTFHRSEPFRGTDAGTDDAEAMPKLRYTIRYVPGSALAGGLVHASQKQGQPFDGPYYPKVWPDFVKKEIDAIRDGLEPDLKI